MVDKNEFTLDVYWENDEVIWNTWLKAKWELSYVLSYTKWWNKKPIVFISLKKEAENGVRVVQFIYLSSKVEYKVRNSFDIPEFLAELLNQTFFLQGTVVQFDPFDVDESEWAKHQWNACVYADLETSFRRRVHIIIPE